MSKLLYKLSANICYIFFKLFYKLEVSGKNYVPDSGSLVIMCNHITYFDPPIIGAILDRQIHFMAKEELFKNPVLGAFLRKIGQFPVKRGKPDRSALKKSFEVLKNGEILGIFPEGTTQGKSGKLGKAKSGAVLIPLKTQTPILPIGIKVNNRNIKVSIGKPFSLDKYYDRKLSKEERREVGQYIMDQIKNQLNRLT